MAASGALGSAPVASFPVAGSPPPEGSAAYASGTSTVTGVMVALVVAVGAATGSSSVSGVGASLVDVTASASGSASASSVGAATFGSLATASGSASVAGVGASLFGAAFSATGSASASGASSAITSSIASASGSASASGVGASIAKSVFSATGSASISGVGRALVPAVATASGSSLVLGVGTALIPVVGAATGSALVYGIPPSVPSVASATGVSTVYGYSPRVVGAATGAAIIAGASPTTYQASKGVATGSATVLGVSLGNSRGIGFGSGASSAAFYSAVSATFTATGASTVLGAGTYTTSGFTPPPPFFYSFTPGPSGTYEEPAFTGNVCCEDCDQPTPEPAPPTAFVWNAAPITNARVCDITWAGERIIIGRASSLWGGDSCVYLSANYGKTFSKLPVTPDNWVNVTMSAAGDLCAAYPLDTQVTYASFDYAASWGSFTRPWGASQTNSAEISDDGKVTIVTANPGNEIYLSTNNGVSWTSKDTGLLPWYDFYTASCLSSNGEAMFAGRSLDKIHRSTNSGGLWAVCNNSFPSQFSQIACSGDGNIVLATSNSGTGWFQVSRDAGLTWTKAGVNPNNNADGWQCCAVSTNGRVMAVGKYGGRLDVSTDFGVTWTTQNVDGAGGAYLWTDIGINYDGTVIVACALNGPLYIGTAR